MKLSLCVERVEFVFKIVGQTLSAQSQLKSDAHDMPCLNDWYESRIQILAYCGYLI